MFPGRHNYGRLREILTTILSEGVSIRRLAYILEKADKLLDSGMCNVEIGKAIAKYLVDFKALKSYKNIVI